MEYAQSDGWIAIHFAQWLGVLLLFGGFLALYYSITTKQEAAAGVARFGFGAAVLTAASLTMLQAIDGVTLKWAVDAWVSAPADLKGAAFTAAEAARWTEYATQSYSNILLGLTLVLYGLAIALGTVYPSLARVDSRVGSGVAWVIHGLMVPYIGLFNSIPRLVTLVLMAVWAFIMGYQMWRTGSRGRIRRTQSATAHAPHANSPTVSLGPELLKIPVPSVRFYSPKCLERKFSETEELLFALPSPLIYYPLNEQPMRFRIRHLQKD